MYFQLAKKKRNFFTSHTFGDVNADGKSDVSFANADLAGTDGWSNPEVMYTWTNVDQDGAFVNNDVEQLDVTGT